MVYSQLNNRQYQVWSSFLTVLIYAFFFYGFQFFLHYIGALQKAPSADNIIFWDSEWYRNIADVGYKPDSHNTGFFILFPWIWKYTFLSTWGISFLNIVFFGAGFSILTILFPLSLKEKILFLSFPSMFYMFIPYTEALFFFLCAACLYGFIKNREALVWVSLILMGLTRSTTIFLFPAIFLMTHLTSSKGEWKKSLLLSLKYLLPLGMGLTLFFLYQYWKTGEWFIYFRTQREHFSHRFAIPSLPFSGHEGDRRTWISALGVFTDFIALLFIIKITLKWLFSNQVFENKAVIIASAYLTMTLIQTLFFNHALGNGVGTSMVGIHRYSFATAFFFVLLFTCIKQTDFKLKHFLVVFFIANGLWLLFDSYVHIQRFYFSMG